MELVANTNLAWLYTNNKWNNCHSS